VLAKGGRVLAKGGRVLANGGRVLAKGGRGMANASRDVIRRPQPRVDWRVVGNETPPVVATRTPGRAAIGLVALLLAAPVCTSSSAATDDTCSPDAPTTCDGFYVHYCGTDGHAAKYNCASDGKTCRLDSEGQGHCSGDCPPGLDASGRCTGARLERCEGAYYLDYDCAQDGEGCNYDSSGKAYCTKPCPADIGNGSCDGTTVKLCNGATYYEGDCAADGMVCAKDSDGYAWCTKPCPPGLDAFGVCDGAVAKRCDGAVLVEIDCGAAGATCGEVSRYGVGCLGCGDATATGTCSPTGTATWCNFAGALSTQACNALGVACAFDATECRYACTSPKGPPCATEGLAEGEARCETNASTHFASIVSCQGGVVTRSECPAASDGAVTCDDAGGKPTCKATCGASKKLCTDRGVLVDCSGDALGWTDCVAYGGTCASTPEPHCACTELPASAARCRDGERPTCKDGAIVFEACSCVAP
jgi:hypothetical protein